MKWCTFNHNFRKFLYILDKSGLLILNKYKIYPTELLYLVWESSSISLSSLLGVEIINDGTPGVIGTLIQYNSVLNLLINLRDNFYWWIINWVLSLFHISCDLTISNTLSYFLTFKILCISLMNCSQTTLEPTINMSSTYIQM